MLFLDIEGGHGGSSNILFNTVKHLNKNKIISTVICKKKGIKDRYSNILIDCYIEKNMPTFSILRKDNRNIIFFILFIFFIWPRSFFFRRRLLKLIDYKEIDIVHCNLISLTFLASWLKKKRPTVVLTLHVRTNPVQNIAAKLIIKLAYRIFNDMIFITPNEKKNMEKILCKRIDGSIIFNSLFVQKKQISQKKKLPLVVLVLSNYSYPRGIDRVIDIATIMPKELRKKIKFIIIGDIKLPRFLPGDLKFLGLMGKTLKDYASLKRVADLFEFTGHKKSTNTDLDRVDILIKPTRENNPWGRDILEALAKGKAVVSIGTYDKFVKTRVTGLLQTSYDPKKVVEWLQEHANNLKLFDKYRKNGIKIILENCDPIENAEKAENFWTKIYITTT